MSTSEALVVDDEEMVCTYLELALARLGVRQVHVAKDGPTALATLAERAGIRLLLLDVRLPGMNGFDVLSAVRVSRPSLSVVLMSGDPGDEHKARASGASAFLAKPFAPGHLADAIRSCAGPECASEHSPREPSGS